MISPHLALAEFTVTQHRAFLSEQARPPPHVLMNAIRFARQVFEPARQIVGPLRVTSGWRCFGLNVAVGGSPTSAHVEGLAADVVPTAMRLIEACEEIARSEIQFDQLIFEHGRWLHLSAPPSGVKPRRAKLMLFRPGQYLAWDAEKVRRGFA